MELWRQERLAIAGWFAFAAFICWPIAFTFQSQLIGDPAIDVWNHAWGYWYVFQHLAQFQLPLQTDLLKFSKWWVSVFHRYAWRRVLGALQLIFDQLQPTTSPC